MRRGQITEHFSWREARSRDGAPLPEEYEANVQEVALMAEVVREYLGNRPMRVLSWHRSPEHNKRVGGAAKSLHLTGRAMDFVVKDLSPRQVQARCAALQSKGLIGGLGRYQGFTHIDIGRRRSWGDA